MKRGQIIFASVNITIDAKSIEMHHIQLSESVPCKNISFKVQCVIANEIKCGYVAADTDHDPP